MRMNGNIEFPGDVKFEGTNVETVGDVIVDLESATAVKLPATVTAKSNVSVKTDDYTVLAAESGTKFAIGTDAKTFTLPAAVVGLSYGFYNIGGDGNNYVEIQPDGTETITGTIANAAADSVASAGAGKYFRNTKLTAIEGDYVEVTCFIAGDWSITGGVGIWASEA